jgi:hypothetical protein
MVDEMGCIDEADHPAGAVHVQNPGSNPMLWNRL